MKSRSAHLFKAGRAASSPLLYACLSLMGYVKQSAGVVWIRMNTSRCTWTPTQKQAPKWHLTFAGSPQELGAIGTNQFSAWSHSWLIVLEKKRKEKKCTLRFETCVKPVSLAITIGLQVLVSVRGRFSEAPMVHEDGLAQARPHP